MRDDAQDYNSEFDGFTRTVEPMAKTSQKPVYPPAVEPSASDDVKEIKLNEALTRLFQAPDVEARTDGEIEAFARFFENLYANDFRHHYSDVATLIYGEINEEERTSSGEALRDSFLEDIPDRVTLLSTNIGLIEERIQSREIRKKVDKLQDHIELELCRMRFIVRQDKYNAESERDLDAKLSKAKDEVEKLTDSLDKRIDEELKQTQRDYTTILGIFTGVVASIFTGLSFASSSFAALNTTSAAKLVFTSLLMAVLLFDLIGLLFIFLNRLAEKSVKWIVVAMVLITGLLVAAVAMVLFDWGGIGQAIVTGLAGMES